MILPIYAYGQPVLKKRAAKIDQDYADLDDLISDMWETMYNAQGVGLAAPQVGRSIRLFLIDTIQLMKEGEEEQGIKKVFINAKLLDEEGDFWAYEEGCLSIPKIRGDVERPEKITIQYQDEDFNLYTRDYEGINARVIQHEYDHIEGNLFTEKLKPLKRKLIRRKLELIKKGNVKADYRLKFV
jgi:peptide deformylase